MTTSQRYFESKPAGKLSHSCENMDVLCPLHVCWYWTPRCHRAFFSTNTLGRFADMEWQTPAVSEKYQSRFGRRPGTTDSVDTGIGTSASDSTEGDDFCCFFLFLFDVLCNIVTVLYVKHCDMCLWLICLCIDLYSLRCFYNCPFSVQLLKRLCCGAFRLFVVQQKHPWSSVETGDIHNRSSGHSWVKRPLYGCRVLAYWEVKVGIKLLRN